MQQMERRLPGPAGMRPDGPQMQMVAGPGMIGAPGAAGGRPMAPQLLHALPGHRQPMPPANTQLVQQQQHPGQMQQAPGGPPPPQPNMATGVVRTIYPNNKKKSFKDAVYNTLVTII